MSLFVQQVVNGLVIGSSYAVIAVGFSLVFSVMRVVNLAHPDFLMVAMFIALVVAANLTSNPVVILVVVVLGIAGLALLLEKTVLRPLRRQPIIMPLIATAGVSIMLQHGIAGLFGVDPVRFPPLIPTIRYSAFGVLVSSTQLLNLVVASAMMLTVSVYVRRTKWGRATRAVAESPEMAASVGVDVTHVSKITIVLASTMAAVAGLSIGSLYESAWAFIANFYALKSFTIMLVAGNRHVEAVIAVALLLGVVEALVTGYISSALRDAVAFALLIAVLLVRPNGLFGSYRV